MPRFCTALGLAALALTVSPLAAQVQVTSPDGRNQVTVELREGKLTYGMTREAVIAYLNDRIDPTRLRELVKLQPTPRT